MEITVCVCVRLGIHASVGACMFGVRACASVHSVCLCGMRVSGARVFMSKPVWVLYSDGVLLSGT